MTTRSLAQLNMTAPRGQQLAKPKMRFIIVACVLPLAAALLAAVSTAAWMSSRQVPVVVSARPLNSHVDARAEQEPIRIPEKGLIWPHARCDQACS